MVEIRLTNSKTRTKEVFTPIDPENVRMYVCGPTVYDRAHLGNARPVVVFDVLNRLLRHVYGADHVTYVRNFTDVDDKINATALQRKEAGAPGTLEELIAERTEETIGWYHADMDALGTLRPDHEPRATRYIPQMVAMIEGLIASGHAYEAEGHVLFAVDSYAEYGALSGRSVEDMIAGARVEVAPYKKNPMDFVLWKPSSDDLPGWDSPWGRGRPGWHIECSAMADELLGAEFDIHGGGIDLQFPHHENEIAQSCCAHPEGGFANIWLHNEMLQVEGKKMSKSLGNFFTVRDLLDGNSEYGKISGDVVRMAFLLSHYRSPIDLSGQRFAEGRTALNEIAENMSRLGSSAVKAISPTEPIPAVVEHLADDLDTIFGIAELRVRLLNKKKVPLTMDFLNAAAATLVLLGFDIHQSNTVSDFGRLYDDKRSPHDDSTLAKLEESLVYLRDDAKVTKDFSQVDELKAALIRAGVEVRMTKQAVYLIRGFDFDPAKLEGLS
ncbi:MAG: cysteine--tRNA ligase [Pseudooceanicola atlanticus]